MPYTCSLCSLLFQQRRLQLESITADRCHAVLQAIVKGSGYNGDGVLVQAGAADAIQPAQTTAAAIKQELETVRSNELKAQVLIPLTCQQNIICCQMCTLLKLLKRVSVVLTLEVDAAC
jgi:lactam utilization protein B